jgi:serine/threonine protein kinase
MLLTNRKLFLNPFDFRDLAARNCLIDKKGRVKVADFGLSRALQSDEEYFCQIKEVPIRWWAVEVFSNGLFFLLFIIEKAHYLF